MNSKLKLNLKRAFWIESMILVFSTMIATVRFYDGFGFWVSLAIMHLAILAIGAGCLFFIFCCFKLADLWD